MATQPTNLPVPSESPRDLKFNAGKIDEFVTSLAQKYIDRFGGEHYTIEGIKQLAFEAMSSFGYVTLNSFEDGATLTNPNQALLWESNGEYYKWTGNLPKTVPVGSTPESTGGIGAGAWLSIGDSALRSMLASAAGTDYVHTSGEKFTDVTVSKYLAWRNGDISAFGGKYDDETAGALNKSAFAEMETTFGGVRLNLMGKSVYLPDDMNLQVSSLDIFGGGTIYAADGLGFILKKDGYIDAHNFHVEGLLPSESSTPRLFGVSLGSAYKVGDISLTHFTTKGRVILFSGMGQLSVNPDDVDYGCNSLKLSHFNAENTYDHLIVLVDWPFNTLEISNFKVHNMAGTLCQASTNNENSFHS